LQLDGGLEMEVELGLELDEEEWVAAHRLVGRPVAT